MPKLMDRMLLSSLERTQQSVRVGEAEQAAYYTKRGLLRLEETSWPATSSAQLVLFVS